MSEGRSCHLSDTTVNAPKVVDGLARLPGTT
jgi:hypothetical protein